MSKIEKWLKESEARIDELEWAIIQFTDGDTTMKQLRSVLNGG